MINKMCNKSFKFQNLYKSFVFNNLKELGYGKNFKTRQGLKFRKLHQNLKRHILLLFLYLFILLNYFTKETKKRNCLVIRIMQSSPPKLNQLRN